MVRRRFVIVETKTIHMSSMGSKQLPARNAIPKTRIHRKSIATSVSYAGARTVDKSAVGLSEEVGPLADAETTRNLPYSLMGEGPCTTRWS